MKNHSIVSILLIMILGAGCASTQRGTTDAGSSRAETDANRFIDWQGIEGKWPRHLVAQRAMLTAIPYSAGYFGYREFTKYDGPVQPIELEAFRELPASSQAARRKAARNYLWEGMAVFRVLGNSWALWTTTLDSDHTYTGDYVRFKGGLVAYGIRNFRTAAGLDPANLYTWMHLATFYETLGDHTHQREALENALNLLPNHTTGDDHLLKLQLWLDKGWLERCSGHFEAGLAAVDSARAIMASDEIPTEDFYREGRLLQALLLVDLGRIHDARALAKGLPPWEVPIRRVGEHLVGRYANTMSNHSQQSVPSDFARQWIWAMTYLKQEEAAPALRHPNHEWWNLVLPPRISHRFWQDMGRIQEHFGHVDDAEDAYVFAVLTRPFLAFYPVSATRGLSRIFGQDKVGRPYFLSFGCHFIGGSYFSYAANRVVHLEIAGSPGEKLHKGNLALATLDNCVQQGIRPGAALALRGRVHYRLGQMEMAEKDLLAAHDILATSGQESPDVIKLLGVLLFDREDYAGTLEHLLRYNELRPRDAFGWRLGGLAQAHLGNLKKAEEMLNVALDLDPQSGTAWYNRALVHLKRKDFERARQDLIYAGRLMPGNEDVKRLEALVRNPPESPVKVVSSPVDLRISRQDSLLFAQVDQPQVPDLTAGIPEEELQRMLKTLRQVHEQEGTTHSRLVLAQALVRAGRHKEVRELLGPHWPANLSLTEKKLLLGSDRASGRTARAVALTRTLQRHPGRIPDSELWALVAVICLENGAGDAGRLALDQALVLDPENVALLRMRHGGG